MKKLMLFLLSLTLVSTLAACGDSDFDENSTINVYTRDTSSGTRDGFMSGIGFSEAATDDSLLVSGFTTNDNAGIMNAMRSDRYGIGYVSLSSVNDTIKALSINGVEPTFENVMNDTYSLKRPFNFMLRLEEDYENETKYLLARAFEAFITSEEGADAIDDAGAIGLSSEGQFSTIAESHPVCALDNSDITLNIGGSNSVTKVAESLTAAFGPRCGNPSFVHNHTGSSDGFKRTQGDEKDSPNALDIGFASRDFRGEELINGDEFYAQAAWDAIVVIVHLDNPVQSLTLEDLKNIYSGEIQTWQSLID